MPRNLRHCRRSLAVVASVAAGLHFAMHNNQPKAEAAQWRHQHGIGAHHATIEEEDNPEDGENLFVQQKSNGSGTGDMILIFWNRIEE